MGTTHALRSAQTRRPTRRQTRRPRRDEGTDGITFARLLACRHERMPSPRHTPRTDETDERVWDETPDEMPGRDGGARRRDRDDTSLPACLLADTSG